MVAMRPADRTHPNPLLSWVYAFWNRASEILIFLVVVLLLFGASRVPEIGRSMGKGMREFKDAVSGRDEDAAAATSARA